MHSNELNGYKQLKTLSEWQLALWETNVEKGWHTLKRTPLEMHALITTEIAEATEAVRDGIPAVHIGDNNKPEGEAIELTDAVIRIMNYFSEMGWDLDFCLELKNNYNKTRERLHGKRM